MNLKETIIDFFYKVPDLYLMCIKAGAKYLEKEPYPKNDQNIKWENGFHPEKVTSRETWWKEALNDIKPELKDYFGPGYTKQIKGIIWTLADEGNDAIENVKEFISSGTCEQYETFLKEKEPNPNDAGGQFMNKPKCVKCGSPLSFDEIEAYGDTCEACSIDFSRDRYYDSPDVADLYDSIINEGTNNKKNFFDTKGERIKLQWNRPKVEKTGFGEDKLKESTEEETILDSFSYFLYQVYNGGVEQPIAVNTHYSDKIREIMDEHLSPLNIISAIYAENEIPEDVKPEFEQFIRDVCTVCSATENLVLYKGCPECGGSGEISEEDDEGDITYTSCYECHGTGEIECDIDEVEDTDIIINSLSDKALEAWRRLEDVDFETMKRAFGE